jgi:hypothetical protein
VSAIHNWITERRERLAKAIAFLRRNAIIVDQIDKRAPIAMYRVSGKRYNQLAEDVIAHAESMGWRYE